MRKKHDDLINNYESIKSKHLEKIGTQLLKNGILKGYEINLNSFWDENKSKKS